MEWFDLQLESWGRTASAQVDACRPQNNEVIAHAISEKSHNNGIIAYGAGRSYGDAPLNHNGQALLTHTMNRVIDFDHVTGKIICEPGVTFAELIDQFLPHGYLVPVSPGTGFVTIGGAVANDIHGKNHEHHGSFGQHVQWMELMLPDASVCRISRDNNAELFFSTIAGIGLTGIILAVCFYMQKVPSNAVTVTETRAKDLDAFIAAFEESRHSASYSVGWIDALAGGKNFGRGILETAEYSPDNIAELRQRKLTIPFDFPGFALNPVSIGLFNSAYYRRVPSNGRRRQLHLTRFLYPLDTLHKWNRIYGKRGLYQFQCVLPDSTSVNGLQQLLETIRRSRAASFLAVLKTLGGEGDGYLSFPMKGYTLALDFPCKPGMQQLIQRLEEITLEHGGRVYLAKDACLSAERFSAMYPKLDLFRNVLSRIDPEQRMNSDMARRLGMDKYHASNTGF